MSDDSTSGIPKPKAKWYIRPLSMVFMLSLMGINTAIDNAKIDPSWVLRTLFLVIAGGVAVAIWYSERSVKRSTSGASPDFDIVRELGQAFGVSQQGGYAVPSGFASPINCTLALVFQVVSLIFGVIYDIMKLRGDDPDGGAFVVPVLITAVFTILFWTILHYRCWRALPAKYSRATPGKAVGFMFIPIYNFYWAFISFVALPRGFVSHVRDSGNEPASDPTALGIAMAVLFVGSLTIGIVPGFASVLGIASFVVWILYYRQIVPLANAAMNAPGEAMAPAIPRSTSGTPGLFAGRTETIDSPVVGTQLPPGAPPIPKATIYVHKDGINLGPYTLLQTRAKLESGAISRADFTWQEGCSDWGTVEELLSKPLTPA